MKVFLALVAGTIAASAFQISMPQAAEGPSPGEYLARAGNCVVCHTAPGGRPFAGGLKMATPGGVIYSTNITPDKNTGIGNYTLEEFGRAMRQGIAKDGHRLYPAMPYPSYAKLNDEDIRSLFDFFTKEVTAVSRRNEPSELAWPLSMRWTLALWSAFMTDSRVYSAKPENGSEWNRGAYLVQGLGHCGACHTPRGWAFQEKALDQTQSGYLSGNELDNWSASNLTGDPNTGLGRWTERDIRDFLKRGRNRYAAAFGTMIDVINNSTQYLSDADLTAIAKYLKSLPPAVDGNEPVYAYGGSEDLRGTRVGDIGATVFFDRCEACHGQDGRGQASILPMLAGNPTVLDKNPVSLINIVLNGSSRIVVEGTPDIYRMTPFREVLTDSELAAVVTFIRSAWGNSTGAITPAQVAVVRASTARSSDRVTILRMR
jgi:alcohol dehydrogenase (quinone), cytochrome c subunit